MKQINNFFTCVFICQQELSSCCFFQKGFDNCIKHLNAHSAVNHISSSASASVIVHQTVQQLFQQLPIKIPHAQLVHIHYGDPVLYNPRQQTVFNYILCHEYTSFDDVLEKSFLVDVQMSESGRVEDNQRSKVLVASMHIHKTRVLGSGDLQYIVLCSRWSKEECSPASIWSLTRLPQKSLLACSHTPIEIRISSTFQYWTSNNLLFTKLKLVFIHIIFKLFIMSYFPNLIPLTSPHTQFQLKTKVSMDSYPTHSALSRYLKSTILQSGKN